MALWLLLLFVGSSQSFSYYGTVLTYYPKNTDINGSYTVEFRYKMTTGACEIGPYTWDCLSGDCGTEVTQTTDFVDKESEGQTFCQMETKRTLQVPTNAPFQLSMNMSLETWSGTLNGNHSIRALTLVDLRTRSDTGRANRPPQATIMSPVQIPSNCPREMSLFTFDPDGDSVQCRYARKQPYECDGCEPPPGLYLSSGCSLSFYPSSRSREGLYSVELMMEDYHSTEIILTQSFREKEERYLSKPISLIPFQFALILLPPVPSCTEGEYLPRFVEPTPEHGAQLSFTAGVQQHIVIRAEASAARVSGLLFSGPPSITETPDGDGRFNLTWTPSEDDDGQTFPLCFVAKGLFNSSEYHSDVRCVVLGVGNIILPPELPLRAFLSGAAMTYYHNATGTDGSVLGILRTKLNSDTCSSLPSFYCFREDYESQTLVGSYTVDKENSGEFCQTETIHELRLPTEFELYLLSWTSNFPFPSSFFSMDLRTRSDTLRSNRPPITTVPPVLRIPKNCPRDYKILAFDDDGDEVKLCSYYFSDDCLPCNNSGPGTSEFCVKSYDPTTLSYYEGPYTIYGSLKDFPRHNIALTQTDGSLEVKTSKDAISKLSVGIVLKFEEAVPSCSDGVYLPKFVPPTPEYGVILSASAGQTLNITIKAEASVSNVSELLFSAPHEMMERTTGEGEFVLTWTPSEAETGQSHPVCFLVQAALGSSKYQTEPRCVVVRVGPTTPVPPLHENPFTDYVVLGNTRVSSSTPPTEADIELVLEQLRAELIRRGLPPDIVVKRPDIVVKRP